MTLLLGKEGRLRSTDMRNEELLELQRMNEPDRSKLRKLVEALEVDEEGRVSPEGVGVLFSGLLEIPMEEIYTSNEEILEFASKSYQGMVEMLTLTLTLIG